MKDKERIEEMAKVMCENDCEECSRESIEFYGNSYDEDTQCLFNAGAERLYNAGYRNCKDKVVLSKEGYDELCKEKNDYKQRYESLDKKFNQLVVSSCEALAKKSKETAEKILNETMHIPVIDGKFVRVGDLIDKLEEIATREGVEIKE